MRFPRTPSAVIVQNLVGSSGIYSFWIYRKTDRITTKRFLKPSNYFELKILCILSGPALGVARLLMDKIAFKKRR